MRNIGIAKWRYIDPKKHQAAVKALPLGSDVPFETEPLREPWIQRVKDATSGPRLSPEQKWEQMVAENKAEEKLEKTLKFNE